MLIDVITNASFLISAFSFFTLAVLFGDTLLLRFDLKTLLKSLGFALYGISLVLNLTSHGYSTLTLWLMAGALLLIYECFILDPLSKLRILALVPAFLIPLLPGFLGILSSHMLLFSLGILTTLAVFQLAYTTKHRDLIPVGIGFTLLTVGEYLYHLQNIEKLSYLSAAGAFLYLFSSFVLVAWAWSYFAIRFMKLMKS